LSRDEHDVRQFQEGVQRQANFRRTNPYRKSAGFVRCRLDVALPIACTCSTPIDEERRGGGFIWRDQHRVDSSRLSRVDPVFGQPLPEGMSERTVTFTVGGIKLGHAVVVAHAHTLHQQLSREGSFPATGPPNTGDKLRSSIACAGFVCFIPLFDCLVILTTLRLPHKPNWRRWWSVCL
jgi:hypothetical protein